MSNFRIPNLNDPKNEVVQYLGIVIAALVWVVDFLEMVDLTSASRAIASVAVLLGANKASTKVYSAGSVAAERAHV